MQLPYLRFIQEVRLTGERVVEAERRELRTAAFIGWQVRSAVGLGGQQPTFARYLAQLGIPTGQRPGGDAARDRAQRDRVMQAARDAFAQHGASRVE